MYKKVTPFNNNKVIPPTYVNLMHLSEVRPHENAEVGSILYFARGPEPVLLVKESAEEILSAEFLIEGKRANPFPPPSSTATENQAQALSTQPLEDQAGDTSAAASEPNKKQK